MSFWNPQAAQQKGGYQSPDTSSGVTPGQPAIGGANNATISGNPNTWNPAQTPGGNNYTPDPRIAQILQSRVDAAGGNDAVNNLWNSAVNYTAPQLTPPPAPAPAPPPPRSPAPYVNPGPPANPYVPPTTGITPPIYTTPVAPPGGYGSTPAAPYVKGGADAQGKPMAAPSEPVAATPSAPSIVPQSAPEQGYQPPSYSQPVAPVFSSPVMKPTGQVPAASGNPVVNAMYRRAGRDRWNTY